MFEPGQIASSNRWRWAAGASIAMAVIGGVRCSSQGDEATATQAVQPQPEVGCGTTRDTPGAELPEWSAASGMPADATGIVSTQRNLIAYPMARPLRVKPPADGPLNKVLIYTRTASQTLSISATLGDDMITSSRFGPGQTFPGYINVDRPGCWRIDVTTDDGIETVFLDYA